MNEASEVLPLFHEARRSYHAALLDSILHSDKKDVPTNADSSSAGSIALAQGILSRIRPRAVEAKLETRLERLAGQRAGREFEKLTAAFIQETFAALGHLRPGKWRVLSAGAVEISQFEQYRHLLALDKAAKDNPELAVALGSDYVIRPDIVVVRKPEEDEVINDSKPLVDGQVSRLASLRAVNGGGELLHASISCKWTIRSDRVQNARSEALSLIRSRKGHAPHILIVTGEPTPVRLASIALGTGDIDCVYHFALHELLDTLKGYGDGSGEELLRIMVEGKRLKDISDLPLDLAV